MGIAKWHMIDNLVRDLKVTVGIKYNNCGAFVSSQKMYKDDYKLLRCERDQK